MEGVPKTEHPIEPTSDISTDSKHPERVAEIVGTDFRAVLEAIKLLGPDNPHNRELILRWTLHAEEIVRQNRERQALARASIRFNIERAELYFAAGDTDDAIDCLYDAIDQATGEGHEDLREDAQRKADAVTVQNRWET